MILFPLLVSHSLICSEVSLLRLSVTFSLKTEKGKFTRLFPSMKPLKNSGTLLDVDTLLNIEEGEHPVHELLRNFFLHHKIAYWHFKYFFDPNSKDRQRFKETWNNYKNFYNENYKQGAVLAQFASAKTEYEIQKLNELRQHIENLLKFTT